MAGLLRCAAPWHQTTSDRSFLGAFQFFACFCGEDFNPEISGHSSFRENFNSSISFFEPYLAFGALPTRAMHGVLPQAPGLLPGRRRRPLPGAGGVAAGAGAAEARGGGYGRSGARRGDVRGVWGSGHSELFFLLFFSGCLDPGESEDCFFSVGSSWHGAML